MTVYRCKMCGGTIEFEPGSTVGICDSCGTKQTLPKTDNEVLSNLFNRANNLRLKCEFDKAEQIYEKIVEQDDSEAEAHWGIVLCKYGIEYVEDPKTLERIPTCHRTLYEPITADVDYLAAIDYSDASQQVLYEKEARAIDRIQKGILEIVRNENPFDVFICYKETDENGKRTIDSAIANDIYYQLTQEGLKVFYAPITLEDKVGQEYEPYIFAALNSAKVMLALGTKPEYFSAVWVKNEWSRFMKLMKTDRSKLLIPCYRDMDAYDLPEEFAHLQAQDMGKIGFINDVVRGIRKVVLPEKADSYSASSKEVALATNASVEPLLKRAYMFLEDGSWQKADEFCEQVLNQDPENALAYFGKLMAELNVRRADDLKNCKNPFDGSNNYQKALRFGNTKLIAELEDDITFINERNENARKQEIYEKNKRILESSKVESELLRASTELLSIKGYKDAEALYVRSIERAEECRKDEIYFKAISMVAGGAELTTYQEAIDALKLIPNWKDSSQIITEYEKRKEEISQIKKEKNRQEKIAEKKKKKRRVIVSVICVLVLLSGLLGVLVNNNKKGIEAYNNKDYYHAVKLLRISLGNNKNEYLTKATEQLYELALNDIVRHKISSTTIDYLETLQDYSDSSGLKNYCEVLLNMTGEGQYSGCNYDNAISFLKQYYFPGDWLRKQKGYVTAKVFSLNSKGRIPEGGSGSYFFFVGTTLYYGKRDDLTWAHTITIVSQEEFNAYLKTPSVGIYGSDIYDNTYTRR